MIKPLVEHMHYINTNFSMSLINSSTPAMSQMRVHTSPSAWLPVFWARALHNALHDPMTPPSVNHKNKIQSFLNCLLNFDVENSIQNHGNWLHHHLCEKLLLHAHFLSFFFFFRFARFFFCDIQPAVLKTNYSFLFCICS